MSPSLTTAGLGPGEQECKDDFLCHNRLICRVFQYPIYKGRCCTKTLSPVQERLQNPFQPAPRPRHMLHPGLQVTAGREDPGQARRGATFQGGWRGLGGQVMGRGLGLAFHRCLSRLLLAQMLS